MGRRRSWTDDQLRAAVAESFTFKEVVERLRAVAGGASHRSVRTRIDVLELDVSHFDRSLPRAATGEIVSPRSDDADWTPERSWSNDDLRAAVAAATSLNGVFAELGLIVGGTQWIVVRQMIQELGLPTDHWRQPLGSHRYSAAGSWTDADLSEAVLESRSYAEVMRRLGVKPGGGTHRKVKARIEELGLSTAHMSGQAWLGGGKHPNPKYRYELEEILVADSDYLNNRSLKNRLIRAGLLDERCARCGLTEWNELPIVLHLDHINGDRRDNRLENLRLVCPNCHSQTDTYCGRNVGRYAEEDRAVYDAA